MIFISHTKADKPLVESIAQHLASVFSPENVFYDSWSIQPGDGIIDKMNDALSKCKFFFFFVSKKSLTSEMVKLEWQNAVLKATKGETKIIPVKLDDCLMPAILLQTLYIDVYGQGPENAIRQMIDVVYGKNTFVPNADGGYQNIRGYISKKDHSIQIEFRAESYMEPHSNYLILLENDESEISWTAIGESQFESGFQKDLKLDNGQVSNAIFVSRMTATSPGFPFVVELTTKNNSKIRFVGLMRQISRESFIDIPIIEV